MRLKYPFGNVPDIEARISWHYNENWEREVIITWHQKDGLGFSWEEIQEYFPENKLKEAKAVVEGMRGVFEFQPQPGKGHVLTLRYPKLDFYAEGDKPESFSWQMRILVIDPDQNFIDQVFNKYTPLKYIVEEATDGEAGLEIFRKEEVHLTIIDEHMPGSSINGVEVIQRIKNMDSAACCVMTTFSGEDKASQDRARKLGVIAYYVKPFNFERLNFSITETRGVFKLRDIVKQWSMFT
jgi:CheY-like chemotaxis protein